MHFQRKAIMNYSYSNGDQIGNGFSSIVYKGINDITQEDVAIKVIKNTISDQLPFIQNEILILQNLKGRNILKLHDFFQTQNNLYIITEYCKQGNLATYLKSTGPIQYDVAIRIISQIIDGVAQMQQENILHRDLKPQNILLNDGAVKIADFGFAKELNKLKYEMNLGTPLYMSPETMLNNQYNKKSDIWSLGVLCFEILYGKAPWKSQSEIELQYEITHQKIQFPDFPIIPEEAKQLIINCLNIDIKQRYSIKELQHHPLFYNGQRYIKQIPRMIQKINSRAAPIIPKIARCDSEQCILAADIILLYQQYLHLISQINQTDFNIITPLLKQKFHILSIKHLLLLSTQLKKQFIQDNNELKIPQWKEFSNSSQYELAKQSVLQDDLIYQQLFKKNFEMILNFNNQNDIENKQMKEIKYMDYESFYQLLGKFDITILQNYIKSIFSEYFLILEPKINQETLSQYESELIFLKKLLKYNQLTQKFGLPSEFQPYEFYESSSIFLNQKENQSYSNIQELKNIMEKSH